MTQTIIVYHNAIQQQFWESDFLIPVFICGVVFVAAVIIITAIVDKVVPYKYRDNKWMPWLLMAMAAIPAAMVFSRMLP